MCADCAHQNSVKQAFKSAGFEQGTQVTKISEMKMTSANTSGCRGVYWHKKQQKWVARLKFKGRGFWFALMMITMMLPTQVLMIPQFLLFNNMKMVGTFLPLILPHFFGGAFNIFMVMQFIRGIPKDMDEAARIDGCSWYGIFAKIHIPMIKPCVATIAVLTFMNAWQNFMGPLLYLNSPKQYTVSYALKLFNDSVGNDYGATFAMSVLSLIPILTLFFLFQKQLVEGISIQGLKG